MDESAKSQLVDRLKKANSVLITVSRNPSVDQLAACIGLTILINKLGKHGSAVFSGEVPSTIEFLKPEETLEKTADSLRDFIIALDKSKADKLRYKVEDQMVKIFITPYRTSLSESDLEFSQGDFNVELVIALGVKNQEDLDQAIMAHGRILHDATVACITTKDKSDLGSINWQDQSASSLCELVTDLAGAMGEGLLDQQIATALLTGIIAETDRFSNEKTSSQTMSVSGKLMAAGANQQLVATNLNGSLNNKSNDSGSEASKTDDGTLSIEHNEKDLDVSTLPEPADVPPEQPESSEELNDSNSPSDQVSNTNVANPPRLVTQPPALGGTLTANTTPEQYDPATDPLGAGLPPSPEPELNPTPHTTIQPTPQPQTYTPPPPTWTPPPPPPEPMPPVTPPADNNIAVEPALPLADAPMQPEPPAASSIDTAPHPDKTLEQLEEAVDSPHVDKPDVDAAREQINQIMSQDSPNQPEPDLALNAMPLGQPLHEDTGTPQPEGKKDDAQPAVKNPIGLDPSLFSEPPAQSASAPPVPPPLYPLSDNNADSANPPQST